MRYDIGVIVERAMKPVRLGIIGMGNIGSHHASYLLDGKVKRCELKAVSDAFVEKLSPYKAARVEGLRGGRGIDRFGRSGGGDYRHAALSAHVAGHRRPQGGVARHGGETDLRPQGGRRKADRRAAAASPAGVRRHVPNAHRAALRQNQEAHHRRRPGTDCPFFLDHDGLVPLRGLLCQRRLAGDVEGRRRRRSDQPMPAPTGHAAMASGHAGPRALVRAIGPLSQHRGGGQRHRLPGISQRRRRACSSRPRARRRARTASRSRGKWAECCWKTTN